MKFSRKAMTLILCMLMVFGMSGTVAFANEGASEVKTVSIADWDAYTNHALPMIDDLTDTQTAYVTLYFDEAVNILNETELIEEMTNSITLAGNSIADDKMGKIMSVIVSRDGMRLDFELSGWWAPYNGRLQSTGVWNNLVTVADNKPVDSAMSLIIPNGLTTEVVSRTVADENSNASVTVRIVAPESATRGMVHLAVLKNGETINSNDLGATATGHWHDYLNKTAEFFVENFSGNIETALGDDYTVTGSGDEITITAKNSEAGDILDLHVLSYLNDGTKKVQADTSALESKIAEAGEVDPADWTAESYGVLEDAVAAGNLIVEKPGYYGSNEIEDAVNYIVAAMDNLVDVNAPDEPEIVDPGQGDTGDGGQQGNVDNDQNKGNADEDVKDENVATGDEFPVAMLLGLILASGAVAVISVRRKKA